MKPIRKRIPGLGAREREGALPKKAYQMVFVRCIESRIQFNLCLLMHLIHTGRCSSYLSETVQLVSDHASRTGLRSASTARYILQRLRTVFGERAFSFSGPKAWNALLDRFHQLILLRNNSKHFYLITLSSLVILFL